ncbi:MAG: hypothetical protein AAGH78_13105 [Cyanobacteria bacterium P01_H01_bin.58]
MAALSRTRRRSPLLKTTALWFERLVAIIALCNLLIVLFDLSYIRFRDLYLRFFPEFTTWYGEVFKGIEPERSTVQYLETVKKLEEQVAQTGLDSVQSEVWLDELQALSIAMIDENPFAIADKSGTLERIKNMMRDHVEVDSAKRAFQTFWSREHLEEAGLLTEIQYFNDEIKPLMETNYFRGIGEDGNPTNEFLKLDAWFILLFAAELFARTFYISRRYKNYTWLDALLLRWYDLFLLLPFWQWLRIIPVTVRINQSQLLNLVPLRNRINRIFIASFAVELTEIVVLRVIDQLQNVIKEGNIARTLLANSARGYVDINGVDEVQAIANRLTTLILYQVIPQVKPEIDELLHYNVTRAFDQAPGYQGLRQLPGIGDWQQQMSQQVVSLVSQNLYQALTGALEDKEGAALTQKLISKMGDTVRAEIQRDKTIDELQLWTVALLEEFKINYVQQISAEDVDSLMIENYRIYNMTQERQKKG